MCVHAIAIFFCVTPCKLFFFTVEVLKILIIPVVLIYVNRGPTQPAREFVFAFGPRCFSKKDICLKLLL